MAIRLILLMLIVLFLSFSCSKNERKTNFKKQTKGEIKNGLEEKSITSEKIDYDKDLEEENVSEEQKNVVIKEFTPEIFINLTIVYRSKNKKWLEDSVDFTPEMKKEFLENEHRKFFEKYGITEDDYINYSQTHVDELNNYMSEHPELLSQLIDSP